MRTGLDWRLRASVSTEVAALHHSPGLCKGLGFFEKPTGESPPTFAAAVRQEASVTALSLACPHELALCATAAQGNCPMRTETWSETRWPCERCSLFASEGGVYEMRVAKVERRHTGAKKPVAGSSIRSRGDRARLKENVAHRLATGEAGGGRRRHHLTAHGCMGRWVPSGKGGETQRAVVCEATWIPRLVPPGPCPRLSLQP